jgi:Ran GTPase-activating protein (RanGAP) involved in mRNA processing and transport
VLGLRGCGLGAAAAVALAPNLGALSALAALDLSHNALTPAALWVLAPDVARCAALQRLSLSHNPLGLADPDSWRELQEAIGPNPDPDGPPFAYPEPDAYAEHARDVAGHVRRLGHALEHLDLSCCGLCPISGRALALQVRPATIVPPTRLTMPAYLSF